MKKRSFEGTFQVDSRKRLIGFDIPTNEELDGLKPNQLVSCTVNDGEFEPVTLEQYGTYFACCGVVAANTENTGWDTKDKVDYNCRIETGWVTKVAFDTDKNTRIIVPKSLKHKDMNKWIFNNYMFKALEHMAMFLDITVDRLVDMAKDNMKGTRQSRRMG
jgi:hypothetical protein